MRILMKKLFSLSLLVAVVFMVGCTKNVPTTNEAMTWSLVPTTGQDIARQPYENVAKWFSLQVPGTRTIQENVFQADVVFFSPLSEWDTIKENVSLLQKKLEKSLTPSEYYDITKPELAKTMTDFVEISNETININGIDAQKIIYKGTQWGLLLQREQVYLIKDKVSYVLTYTAPATTFDQFAQTVDEMVATLEIK